MDPTRLRLEVARAKQAEAAAFGEAQKAFEAKAKELSREHDDDVRRLKEVHLRELAAKETQGKSEAALRDLTEEFHHSVGTLQIIKDQLEERTNEFFKHDIDGDNNISFMEFQKQMNTIRPKRREAGRVVATGSKAASSTSVSR